MQNTKVLVTKDAFSDSNGVYLHPVPGVKEMNVPLVELHGTHTSGEECTREYYRGECKRVREGCERERGENVRV